MSYLNTRPLIYGLKLPPIADEIELIEDTPSQLAELLVNDEIDLGLVPVAVIPQMKEYFISSDYCIGTDTEVASVCLFSEVPLHEITKVFLDYQSLSSVALLKWLMKEYWNIDPEIIHADDDDYRKKIRGTTAGLVIGDRAFEQRKISTFIYDLASEWRSITGLPFVFAAWISNKKLDDAFLQKFNEANAHGVYDIESVLKEIHYDIFDLHEYYTKYVSYNLDSAKRKGLALFLQKLK